MPVPTAEQVEARLSSVGCAICKKNTFLIDRRTINAEGDWRSICTNCRYTFPVYTDMAFYLATQPDVQYRLKEIACPACRTRGVTLDFRIMMSVRESFYFVTCTTCTHAFAERSSLEAFE